MKTRRKSSQSTVRKKGPSRMAPRPEDSPIASPRTRSPVKGVRASSVGRGNMETLSMLNMLAEVASVTLHTDPSVKQTHVKETKAKVLPPAQPRKPSEYDLLTLDQIASMTDNQLLKLFAEFESNEMSRRFTYSCFMLPSVCSQYFQSFGSEHKARVEMKSHILKHLKDLIKVHNTPHSRSTYVLESVPARNRRLAEHENSASRKRSTGARGVKTSSIVTGMDGKGKRLGAPLKVPAVAVEKEKEPKLKKRGPVIVKESKAPVKSLRELNTNEPKGKRKAEDVKERKIKSRKLKVEQETQETDDFNNNNNNNDNVAPGIPLKGEKAMEPEKAKSPSPEGNISHDHGYLKQESGTGKEGLPNSLDVNCEETEESSNDIDDMQILSKLAQSGNTEGNNGDETSDVTRGPGLCYINQTLLDKHMTQELHGEMMAHDGSLGTPLPVVGCEVDFQPEEQYKVLRSADLPVVYDHNNPPANVRTMTQVIERDEYKVRKKPKGRAKFIGQSKVEKEMAMQLIAQIRSQSMMHLDTLECKICHPPRLFTAPSTLLSHYRSHAGIRPYECRICNAVFTRQHSLNYHMLIHTNQTRFTCIDCGRKFRHPSHFKEHRRRHTGESPYECSDCLMRFKTRNTYKRHLRTRHGKLLTTQGSIIILSEEEAEKMKKTHYKKVRKPRQPIQIISPETAAGVEEVWTDQEYDGSESDENLLHEKKVFEGSNQSDHFKGKIILHSKSRKARAKQEASGIEKVRKQSPKHGFSKEECTEETRVLLSNPKCDVEREPQLVEEEVITDETVVGDLRTYVFEPPPEHNSLPKVNIRSTWNTINIDLKNLERAADEADEVDSTCITLNLPDLSHPGQSKNSNYTKAVSPLGSTNEDNIAAEEIITISANMENPQLEIQTSNEVKPNYDLNSKLHSDTLTVKKPVKCYGRPGYSVLEPSASLTGVHSPTAKSEQPTPNEFPIDIGKTAPGKGVYVVEYVQGKAGHLAKVYKANATLVSKSTIKQDEVPITTVAANKPVVNTVYTLKKPSSSNFARKIPSTASGKLRVPTAAERKQVIVTTKVRNLGEPSQDQHNKVEVDQSAKVCEGDRGPPKCARGTVEASASDSVNANMPCTLQVPNENTVGGSDVLTVDGIVEVDGQYIADSYIKEEIISSVENVGISLDNTTKPHEKLDNSKQPLVYIQPANTDSSFFGMNKPKECNVVVGSSHGGLGTNTDPPQSGSTVIDATSSLSLLDEMLHTTDSVQRVIFEPQPLLTTPVGSGNLAQNMSSNHSLSSQTVHM